MKIMIERPTTVKDTIYHPDSNRSIGIGPSDEVIILKNEPT